MFRGNAAGEQAFSRLRLSCIPIPERASSPVPYNLAIGFLSGSTIWHNLLRLGRHVFAVFATASSHRREGTDRHQVSGFLPNSASFLAAQYCYIVPRPPPDFCIHQFAIVRVRLDFFCSSVSELAFRIQPFATLRCCPRSR